MEHHFWGRVFTGLTAAVLLVGLAFGICPTTVNAAQLQTEQIVIANIMDTAAGAEKLAPRDQSVAFLTIEQFQMSWNQESKMTRSVGESTESLGTVILEPAALEVSQVELDSIWHCPLSVDTYVSSPYGMRWHPVHGDYRMHRGVDLNSRNGDEVLAARGGTVIKVGYNSSAGNYVQIDHGDGFVTEYFHLSRYYVEVGQRVNGGEVIARVGNTGTSTGAHLHFGVMFDGGYVDPEDYIDF